MLKKIGKNLGIYKHLQNVQVFKAWDLISYSSEKSQEQHLWFTKTQIWKHFYKQTINNQNN